MLLYWQIDLLHTHLHASKPTREIILVDSLNVYWTCAAFTKCFQTKCPFNTGAVVVKHFFVGAETESIVGSRSLINPLFCWHTASGLIKDDQLCTAVCWGATTKTLLLLMLLTQAKHRATAAADKHSTRVHSNKQNGMIIRVGNMCIMLWRIDLLTSLHKLHISGNKPQLNHT